MITYAKISPKIVNPKDIAGEHRRRERSANFSMGLALQYARFLMLCSVTVLSAVGLHAEVFCTGIKERQKKILICSLQSDVKLFIYMTKLSTEYVNMATSL